MGLWAVAFTWSALALGATVFDSAVSTQASNVIRIILIAAACVANWICLMHFIRDVFTYKVFTADKMAAPLMFFKLSHEAARYYILTRGICAVVQSQACNADPTVF